MHLFLHMSLLVTAIIEMPLELYIVARLTTVIIIVIGANASGDRPYKCVVDNCTKAFRQLSSLQQHLKGHNLPSGKSFCLSDQTATGHIQVDDANEQEDKKVAPPLFVH